MPSSPAAQNTYHQSSIQFPSPSSFSLLPELHTILSRLSALQQQSINAASPTFPADNPIEPKDLASHVYPLKQRLAKARAMVHILPDVERSVSEQEQEIKMLERKVEALKGRLADLGGIAEQGRSGADTVMEGLGR